MYREKRILESLLSIWYRSYDVYSMNNKESAENIHNKQAKFLNIGAVPGTLFIYFVISLTIHTLFFLGYSFLLSWVSDS
jgi:hypothetical protein